MEIAALDMEWAEVLCDNRVDKVRSLLVARSGWNLTHVFLHSALIPFIVLSTMSGIVIPTASAQQMRGEAVEG